MAEVSERILFKAHPVTNQPIAMLNDMKMHIIRIFNGHVCPVVITSSLIVLEERFLYSTRKENEYMQSRLHWQTV
jgi:hypothetical protein